MMDRAIVAAFAGRVRLLMVASGLVALVYQSLWMRQLSLVLGSTTYAVGTVLAAFMAGLGLGAWRLDRVATCRIDVRDARHRGARGDVDLPAIECLVCGGALVSTRSE
jgi:hypothetical protein